MAEKRREGEGKREGRKEKGREGKGERKGRKEKGREGKGKRERKKKKEEKEEKRRGKQSGYKKMWARRPAFFFLLNNYQVIPFRGNPLSGQRNPFKGGGVIRHPFGGLGLETGQKGCHPLLKGVALF